MEPIKFKEFSAHIDVSFWYELERRKLHDWKLKEPTVTIHGFVPSTRRLKHQISNMVTLTGDSFDLTKREANSAVIPIVFKNFNTIEELHGLDKKQALNQAGDALLEVIRKGENWEKSLSTGLMYTFADLKHHKFSYILAFPALDLGSAVRARKLEDTDEYYSHSQVQQIHDHAVQLAEDAIGATPFVVVQKDKVMPVDLLSFTPKNAAIPDAAIAFADTSSLAEYPGWALRNIIAALRTTMPDTSSMQFLCLRESVESTKVVLCGCDPLPEDPLLRPPVRTHGWVETKVRSVDLQAMMDPSKLAESSAKLNLSLMKWRMMPDIQLDGIQNCRALLLGAGTLGCNIARNLLMWGVTNITLVDRGVVNYSNPVRQTLFELSDVLAEGEARSKALAAAKALKRILPTTNATGVNLTIRMPGHRIDDADAAQAEKDVAELEQLIKDHDVVFLLVDSREARWLPTLLATANDKPIINVALGFDSWVVMRHGLRNQPHRLGCYFCNDVVAPIDSITARSIDQQCTVTRPGVSGLSSVVAVEILASLYNHKNGFLCGGYSEHSDEPEVVAKKAAAPAAQPAPAPAENGNAEGEAAAPEDEAPAAAEPAPADAVPAQMARPETILGIIPHTIRGSVVDYSTTTMRGTNYDKCTACSDIMVGNYLRDGFAFVKQCINDPKYMEEITGLAQEKADTNFDNVDWDEE